MKQETPTIKATTLRLIGPIMVATALACNPAGTRPFYGPFLRAAADTLAVEPDIVLEAAFSEVEARGMAIRKFNAEEGYLETKWFDLRDSTSHGSTANADSVIKIRIWSDRLQRRQAEMRLETVYMSALDPSLPERENTAQVPTDHAGHPFGQQLIGDIKERLGL